MNDLHDGINHTYDRMMLKWLYDNYKDKNIANSLSMKVSAFLGTIELKRNVNKMKRLDGIEKAIRQDFKKMLLSAKKIYDYSMEYEDEETSYSINYYDEKKDSLQINMEYYIYKYRVIVEYIMKILDEIVYMEVKKYKKAYPDDFIDNYERVNKKMKYIRNLAIRNCGNNLDLEWFDEIRRVRNQLSHEGASCVIYENGNEPLFQVYDLEVNDLLSATEFLSNGRVISCKYFIAVTVSYITFFVDTIFLLLNSINNSEEFEWNYCKLNYRVIGGEYKMQLEILDSICGISKNIPIYQGCLFEMVKLYLT